MDTDTFWLALALVFVLEGVFPFIHPHGWRRMFVQLIGLKDGQIRFFGFVSILCGLVLIWFLAP